tara:strand:+ start:1 stop:852 length:852 start_codon:yes stop_codon:yes gene_type:complete
MDSNLYGFSDPYTCGASAVAESVRNLISVGANPIALTDCLNYGNPEKGSVFFDFEQGVQGIADAATKLSFNSEPIPIISGNVSFYNESKSGNAVIPSPVVCAVGKLDNIEAVKTAQFFEKNLTIICIGKRYSEFASTQCEPFINQTDLVTPQVRFDDEKVQNKAILELYNHNLIDSCHDISTGGAWLSLVEMVLGERAQPRVGVELNYHHSDDLFTQLFSENGGFICAVKNREQVQKILEQHNVYYTTIGQTIEQKVVKITAKHCSIVIDLQELKEFWSQYNH